MNISNKPDWLNKKVKGFLLDVNGVLYDSGLDGGTAIPGSVDAIDRLVELRIPFRLCSNETQHTRSSLLATLQKLGFNVNLHNILTPAPIVAEELKKRMLRPYLLVHPKLKDEFRNLDQSEPNCVVVGDAADSFTYDNLNQAFRLLINSTEPKLFSMGTGKFYKEANGLMLDLGAFTKALEYACDITAEIFGKPTEKYFLAALDSLNLKADEVVMIGDDIVSDVGGAQNCGIRAVQVKTGKWRNEWIEHPIVKPDAYMPNLFACVQCVLEYNNF
uniref:Phospholysine phosphohistidine inorganic pyrophosphate phosphatase n=1 Tax=Romanomermis culicivorax TaxID=13658 RepID=A0A915KXY3_ROMCU